MASEAHDKSAKIRTPQLATACLLIKAALYGQYKTAITVGNKFETKTKGMQPMSDTLRVFERSSREY